MLYRILLVLLLTHTCAQALFNPFRWLFGKKEDPFEKVLLELHKAQKLPLTKTENRSEFVIHHHGSGATTTLNTGTVMQIIQHSDAQSLKAAPIQESAPVAGWWQRVKNIFSFRKQLPAVQSAQHYPTPISWKQYVQDNKKSIAMRLAAVWYVYVNCKLFQLASYIQATDRWSQWKADLSLAQLFSIPQNELLQELFAEVQRRSGSFSKERSDTAFVLNSFMQSINEESAAIEYYVTIAETVARVDDINQRCVGFCSSLIPKFLGIPLPSVVGMITSRLQIKAFFYVDEKIVRSCHDRLARIAYLKKVFTQWLSEHKINAMRSTLKCTRLSEKILIGET